MEWQWILVIIFASLIFLMATGIPIALCFLLINVVSFLNNYYVTFLCEGLKLSILEYYYCQNEACDKVRIYTHLSIRYSNNGLTTFPAYKRKITDLVLRRRS